MSSSGHLVCAQEKVGKQDRSSSQNRGSICSCFLVFLRAWPQRVAARLEHVGMDKLGLSKSRGVMLSSWMERPWWNTLFPLKGAPDRPDDFILASEGPVRTGKKLAAKIASSTMVAREMDAWRQKLAT